MADVSKITVGNTTYDIKDANAEKSSNKVTSISSSSTDTQYPSAKCVYDLVGDIESALNAILGGGNVSYTVTVTLSTGGNQATYTDTYGAGTYSEGDTCTIIVPSSIGQGSFAYMGKNGLGNIVQTTSVSGGVQYVFTVDGNTEIFVSYAGGGGN